jgi:hypothetical protein
VPALDDTHKPTVDSHCIIITIIIIITTTTTTTTTTQPPTHALSGLPNL